MGQAKLRRQAQTSTVDVPKDRIAKVIRRSAGAQGGHTGTCLHQAVVGQRVLRRFNLDTVLIAGDFRRPLGDGYQHTYTRDDDRISVRDGAFHAWLFYPSTNEIIDFAAWEAPARMEAEAGMPWPGPRPAYLWESEVSLRRQDFAVMPDVEATTLVRRWEAWSRGIVTVGGATATEFSRYGDAAYVDACEVRAVAALEGGHDDTQGGRR